MIYYNDNDPNNVLILKQLITDGLIPDGDVDGRSIEDIQSHELQDYHQCHFFAGIGGWAYALLLADWPEDRPIWTGSCPCQPFANPGKREGIADERHLWPAWFRHIKSNQPPIVVGEQVASTLGLEWLDVLFTDMETANYACGAADLPAAGVGAPHIRQRLYFVGMGDAEFQRLERHSGDDPASKGRSLSTGSNPSAGCESWKEFNIWEDNGGEIRRPLQPGLRPLDHGISNRMVKIHGYGNAIVPKLAAEFIRSLL